MNSIGIMQGRLSPPVAHRLQAFPWLSWEQEFENARACGLDLIEWLFEAGDGRGHGYEQNPLWSEAGLGKIKQRIAQTGVQVRTCCADYFMPRPFFRVPEKERLQSIEVLKRLITQAAHVGIDTILIPVLEVSEVRDGIEKSLLLQSLREPLEVAARLGVRLGLETELPAREYRLLVEQAAHPALGVYYDTGNNAAQGHDIIADGEILAPFLVGVHVKDRKRGGPSVLLGEGDADLDGFFRVIGQTGYSGPVVLQTAFGEDYLGIARRHLEYVRSRLAS